MGLSQSWCAVTWRCEIEFRNDTAVLWNRFVQSKVLKLTCSKVQQLHLVKTTSPWASAGWTLSLIIWLKSVIWQVEQTFRCAVPLLCYKRPNSLPSGSWAAVIVLIIQPTAPCVPLCTINPTTYYCYYFYWYIGPLTSLMRLSVWVCVAPAAFFCGSQWRKCIKRTDVAILIAVATLLKLSHLRRFTVSYLALLLQLSRHHPVRKAFICTAKTRFNFLHINYCRTENTRHIQGEPENRTIFESCNAPWFLKTLALYKSYTYLLTYLHDDAERRAISAVLPRYCTVGLTVAQLLLWHS